MIFKIKRIDDFQSSSTTAGPQPVGKPGSSNVLDRSARISWPPSADPVDEYEVTIKDPSGNTRIVKVSGSTNQVTVGQLTPGTTYTTTVRGVKDGVQSTTSPESDPFTTLADGELHLAVYIFF